MSQQLAGFWRNSIDKFKGNPLSFNFKYVVLKCLGERRSDIYTHFLHSYPAKIFPYIPIYLLSIPEICPKDGVVLDPFCGSGTILLESIVHPIHKRSIYGIEINPLGRLITKVKTTPLEDTELIKRFDNLDKLAKRCNSKEFPLPDSEKIKFWFSREAIYGLSKLRYLIEQEEEDDYKDFFWVCFSSVVRKVSKADPYVPPPVLLRIEKYRKSRKKYDYLMKFLERAKDPGVVGLFRKTVERNFQRIRSLSKIKEVKESEVKAQVIWDDARSMKVGELDGKGMLIKTGAEVLPSESIDSVVTSPPYLTAQKYIRTQRLELLWLGFSENCVSSLQKRTIGTERVSLKEGNLPNSIGVETVDSLIEWSSFSPKRAAELTSYFHAMKQAISEIYRVLKCGAYAVIVLGNNKILGKNIETHKLLIDLACTLGFKSELVLKDKIRGRGMISKRHNTGGLIKEEFIIVLKKEGANVQSN